MIKKVPQISFVFDRYKKATASKKASLELRITYQGKQKYISTGIKLLSTQWKKGKIINCEDAIELSQILNTLVSDVRKVLLKMIEDNNIDIFSINKKIQDNTTNTNFLDFCIKRASVRKYGKRKDTQERYDRFIRLFREWGGITSFNDITEENIISYDQYLMNKNLKPYSKWNNYHRFLNGFIIDAIEDGIIQKNPYRWLNIPKEKDSKSLDRCLTIEEVHRIKNTPMPTKCLERVRDIFIFQTYTCMRYSDLLRFDVKYITEIKGMKVYIRNSKKTNKEFVIPLLKPALAILEKYNNHLPVISNVKYNYYLKIIAQAAGMEYPLTTHWARHSGATILLNEGIDMKIITKVCGHSSTRITEQVYAKLLNETVVEAISDIDI